MDDIEEEIEHQEFMDSLNYLNEQIMAAWAFEKKIPVEVVKAAWDDIDVYGDEPVFGSLIFDLIVKEHDELNRR